METCRITQSLRLDHPWYGLVNAMWQCHVFPYVTHVAISGGATSPVIWACSGVATQQNTPLTEIQLFAINPLSVATFNETKHFKYGCPSLRQLYFSHLWEDIQVTSTQQGVIRAFAITQWREYLMALWLVSVVCMPTGCIFVNGVPYIVILSLLVSSGEWYPSRNW